MVKRARRALSWPPYDVIDRIFAVVPASRGLTEWRPFGGGDVERWQQHGAALVAEHVAEGGAPQELLPVRLWGQPW